MKYEGKVWLVVSWASGSLWGYGAFHLFRWIFSLFTDADFSHVAGVALGIFCGTVVMFGVMATGGMCCSSGSHLERISQEGVFDED